MYTINNLRDRLKKLESLVDQAQIPPELLVQFNNNALMAINRGVWINTPTKRPFSPLIKNMHSDVVSISHPFSKPEVSVLKLLANHVHRTYGSPQFKYDFSEPTKNQHVKMWQSVKLFSPKVTAGSSKRRFEAFSKFFQEHTFAPDTNTLNKAVDFIKKYLNIPKVSFSFDPQYVKSIFASHSSNVGFPWYANEMTKVKDTTYRHYSVDVTKELNRKYGYTWMAAIPSIIIGRDQPGGNNIDLEQDYTYEELSKHIDSNISYEPSKARPVWAVPRIVNNNINPLLKAVITSPAFLTTPAFCGFKDREVRMIYYQRYHKYVSDKGYIPLNLDFSSFDTTISPEMMLIALDVFYSWIDIGNIDSEQLFETVSAVTIFTKYTCFNPNTNSIIQGMKRGSIPSGIGLTGILGFIAAAIAYVYAAISLYGEKKVEQWSYEVQSRKTFLWAGLGDDLLVFVERHDDLNKLAHTIKQAFGMDVATSAVKTSVGVDFLQEYFTPDHTYYPVGRVMRSVLYTERPKGLGWAQWVMTWIMNLHNLRHNPPEDYEVIARFIISHDKSRLGFFNPDTGQRITRDQYIKQLSAELTATGKTPKQALHDGNPAYDVFFDDGSDAFKSDFLNKIWDKHEPLVAQYLASRKE